jgi:hypothetical protein
VSSHVQSAIWGEGGNGLQRLNAAGGRVFPVVAPARLKGWAVHQPELRLVLRKANECGQGTGHRKS